MGDRNKLDDAAVAALFLLANADRENIGALYGDGEGGYARTSTVSGDSGHVKGDLRIPGGRANLAALFHNHPLDKRSTRERFDRAKFSAEDVQQAEHLGVPSYISAGDRVMRYGLGKTEEVLAQIPLEEIRKLYLVHGLMK